MAILEILAYSSVGAVAVKALDLLQDRLKRRDTKHDSRDEILLKLENIDKKLEQHIKADEADKARQSRLRLLRFDGEVRIGIEHTREHWDDILADIDTYEKYCEDHPEFPNQKAVSCIKHLKDVYDERLIKNDFL